MQKQASYNIAFSINRAYLLFCMVTLYSLLKNNSKYYFNIYIMHNNCLKEEEINKIISEHPLKQFNNLKIHLVDVSQVKDLQKLKAIGNWTKEVYFKLFLDKLLPNVDKILYLDTDIIIRGDIKSILDMNIDNYIFAAASETEPNKYYNAGVLYQNLKIMREEKITEQLMTVMDGDIVHEQDAINILFRDRIKPIANSDIFITSVKSNSTFNKNLIIHYNNSKSWDSNQMRVISQLKSKYIIDYYNYYKEFVDPKYKINFKLYMFFIKTGVLVVFYSTLRRIVTFYQKYTKQPKRKPKFVVNKLYRYATIKKE